MHAAGWFYSQKVSQNPINDAWTKRASVGDGMANTPIIVPKGPKALYDTFYIEGDEDGAGAISRIDRVNMSGKAPNYELADATEKMMRVKFSRRY